MASSFIIVSSGVTSDGVVLSGYDTMTVTSGGTAVATRVGSAATLDNQGGVTSGSIVGGLEWDSGGIASGSTILAGGVEMITGDATGIGATVSSGGAEVVDFVTTASSTHVLSGGVIVVLPYGNVVSANSAPGGAIVSTGVAVIGGTGAFYDGLTASGLVVSAGAEAYILSGGTVSGLVVSGGSAQMIGGSVTEAVIDGGTVTISNTRGVLTDTTITNDGTLALAFSEENVAGGITFAGQGGEIDFLNATIPSDVTITGFGVGDDFVLPEHFYFPGENVTIWEQSIHTLFISAFGTQLSLSLAGDYTNASFVTQADEQGAIEVTVAPCYRRGTTLLAERGPVAIEELTVGDRLHTIDGALRSIRFIGHRAIACDRHPAPQAVWPVRVAAHAFGVGLPQRDLYLSPDHAVFVEDVLIPIRHLLNGTSIRQERVAAVDYFHVELDRHDIILAEGLPAESYLDLGDRASFANGADPIALHPHFGPATLDAALKRDALACAPFAVTGPEVERVKARLRHIAGGSLEVVSEPVRAGWR